MSVITTADEKIKNAKILISDAYKELLIVLDEDTDGSYYQWFEFVNAIELL